MRAKTATIETGAILVPGLIFSVLVLPLLPEVVRRAIVEGESTGALILLGLIVVTLIFVVSALSRVVEKLLVSGGLLVRLNLEGQPAWLTESVLDRIQEHLGVDMGGRDRAADSSELTKSESESLFALIGTYVSEKARASYGGSLSAMSAMFQNLFTVFTTVALIYPFIQPYPLTDRLNFSLGQRLILAAICGILALIALYQSRFYRSAFRRDVVNRFVAITGRVRSEE